MKYVNNDQDQTNGKPWSLKPCPHCGAQVYITTGVGESWIHCKCQDGAESTNERRVVDAWNRRDSIDVFRKEVEKIGSIYTCWNCGQRAMCPFAWDHYNINGDCLWEK